MNYGRQRPPASIKKLPAKDHIVYRYKFEQNLDLDTCLRLLQVSYPQLGRQKLLDTITRIHAMLTSRQRWRLGVQKNRHRPGKELTGGEGRQDDVIVEPGPGPHLLAQQEQERDALLSAMSQLTPQQRLLLRLHYQENMSLRVVARRHILYAMAVIDQQAVASDWSARGFGCDLWIDPPGQRWEDFVHRRDELVMVVEGDMEFEIYGEVSHPRIGEEVCIPAGAVHSVRNIRSSTARWLYGYR
jgi:mannose-6-phosphate isomerase-like protein (cupin superfamily)